MSDSNGYKTPSLSTWRTGKHQLIQGKGNILLMKEVGCFSACLAQGLKMSVRSLIAVTKFLLEEGFEFVLTERFCNLATKLHSMYKMDGTVEEISGKWDLHFEEV